MDLAGLLQSAVAAGAEEVRIAPGRPPVLITDSGVSELHSAGEAPADLAPVIRPALTAEAVQQLSRGHAECRCRVASIGVVRVSAEVRAGEIHATFFLKDDGAATMALELDSPGLSSLPPALEPDAQPKLSARRPPKPESAPQKRRAAPPSAAEAEPAAAPSAVEAPPADASRGPEAPAGAAPQSAAASANASSTHEIDALLRATIDAGGSDLHLSSGVPPIVRKDGAIAQLPGGKTLSARDVQRIVAPIVPVRNRDQFNRHHDTDFAYEIKGLGRFRCNAFVDRKGMGVVFRTIPQEIIAIENLGLPKAILQLCHMSKGLVLVTGPTGSGKSTTLASMIDYINRTRPSHIITIEDPIEYVFENRKCLINQREVGEHTDSFKDALRAALREDPDIVLVGELRDLETIKTAIETAETGHLVFGTLHTTTAPSTVDRIIDQFPAEQQAQIRTMLSESLKAVVCQMLCRKVGGGRVAAMEVLLGVPAVANLIREAKVFQIPSIMQTGRKLGMRTLNDSLLELVKTSQVTTEEALSKTVDRAGLAAALRDAGIDPSPKRSG